MCIVKYKLHVVCIAIHLFKSTIQSKKLQQLILRNTLLVRIMLCVDIHLVLYHKFAIAMCPLDD